MYVHAPVCLCVRVSLRVCLALLCGSVHINHTPCCAPHNYRVRLAATFDNYLHYNFPCWTTAAFSAIKQEPSPKNDAISNVATST